MKLEEQVCSLELAKKLLTLGVKQNSLFKWIKANHPTEKCCDAMVQYSCQNEKYDNTAVHEGWTLTSWAAFTVAELGEMLPLFSNGYNELSIKKNNNGSWIVCYECSRTFDKSFLESKLSDAMAKMLIYLLEKELLTLEK